MKRPEYFCRYTCKLYVFGQLHSRSLGIVSIFTANSVLDKSRDLRVADSGCFSLGQAQTELVPVRPVRKCLGGDDITLSGFVSVTQIASAFD